MTAHQVYEQTVKPLSAHEKLTIVRLIIADVAPDTAPQAEARSECLKRLLPQIERITLSDQDLAGVTLNGRAPGRRG